MKISKLLLLCAFLTGIFCSCAYYNVYEPVYMTYDTLRSAIENETPKGLGETGKIYLKENYIFLNEKNKGVHVIDNANPADPRIITFINIPGNIDIAVKGNILYADSYIDLVALDITNPLVVVEKARIRDAFPFRYNYYYDETNFISGDSYTLPDPALGIVIGWKYVKTNAVPSTAPVAIDYADVGAAGAVTGKGGSLACFTIVGNYLYTVDASTLKLFNIADPAKPVRDANINVGWGIETIFPYNNNLFIGSTRGMYVYSLADPLNPGLLSQFVHATSCDPVVIQGNYAYITLRSGTTCSQGENVLKIVDVTNLLNPLLVMSYAMNNPYGLGVDRNVLFICDNDAGLKVYDCSNPRAIIRKKHFTGAAVIDVIPDNGIAIVIGPQGLYQYDYTNLYNIHLVSTLSITGAL